MYRVWYSTESFSDYIIDHTSLSGKTIVKNKMYESDANNPTRFHTMPDHIRKILYLDAPDLIVEKDNEPVFSIEVTTEAGTGHNAFQRFARIAAAVENSVPAFYIYPEGKLISRTNRRTGAVNTKWDEINPLIFRALEGVMSVYNIPALLYYFPSDDINTYRNNPAASPHFADKGLCFDSVSDYEIDNIFYGIGLPTEKHKEKSKESAHLVNFILGVNSDRSVEVLYNPKKIVL